jgi:hypothetical protein
MKFACLLSTILALAAVPAVCATIVNFDNLNNGDVITNQYAAQGVLFSSTPGNVNYVTTQPSYHGTPPNFLCSGPVNSGIDCAEETIATFTTAVNGLTFQGLGINNVSSNVAQVDVFTNGAFNSTVIIPGNAQGFDPELIDLSAFSHITKIRIYDISDGGGIGWDTFTFTPVSATTPEPATLGLFGAGLCGIALFRRRKA